MQRDLSGWGRQGGREEQSHYRGANQNTAGSGSNQRSLRLGCCCSIPLLAPVGRLVALRLGWCCSIPLLALHQELGRLVARSPGWLLRSDVPFVASTRAGNEVSAKAGLIGVFLPLRSRINKRGCRVLAGLVWFVFSQEASPRENSLCWSRGLNYRGSTSILPAPVIGADLTRALGAISLGLDLLCDSHLLPLSSGDTREAGGRHRCSG